MAIPLLHPGHERHGAPRATLMEPDIITGYQFSDQRGMRSLATDRSEYRLMLAVLEQALADIQALPQAIAYYAQPTRRRQATTESQRIRLRDAQAEYDEALDWFRSSSTRSPFAFLRICEAVGFDPAAIRRVVDDGGLAGRMRLSRIHRQDTRGATRALGRRSRDGVGA